MPLLIDGQPWEPTKDEKKLFEQQTIWHLPPKPYDARNERNELPAGIGIPNKYNMRMNNGATKTVIYFTNRHYDDALKKDFFFVGATGEFIQFDSKGKITTSNPELNYFLHNCPHNKHNPLRMDTMGGPNPYRGQRILFQKFQARESYQVSKRKAEAITKLTALIHPTLGKNPWTTDDIKFACENILAQATFRIPTTLTHYKQYLDEDNMESLRFALIEVAMNEPIQTEAILLTSRQGQILKMLNKVIEHKDISGIHYNETERKYVIKAKNGQFEDFIVVDSKKNPEQFALNVLMDDNRKMRKLSDLNDLVEERLRNPVVTV